MDTFKFVQYARQAKKFLEKCNQILYHRLVEKINLLSQNPFPPEARKVLGEKEPVYRVRVGDSRILYAVFQGKNIIFITVIDKRSRVYD